MPNSKHLFSRELSNVPTKVAIIILIVALLGFADATYLTIEHYKGVIPPCSLVSGCEVVLTSAYSVVAGMPVSLLGAIGYLLILVGTFAYLDSKSTRILKYALLLTIPAFLASLWLLYVQAFILHSYCQYCLGSAATSIVLFVLSMWVFSKYSTTATLPE